jgi:phenylacetate-coenzyme A ligase PaaK-like adenylate-forming protein
VSAPAPVLKNDKKIFGISSDKAFQELALEVFLFQYEANVLYRQWTDHLKIRPAEVKRPEDIPFLPIEFFKRFQVLSSPEHAQTVRFTSSSTTSQVPSVHHVNDIALYEHSFLETFRRVYGDPEDYCILALLPNYLQRGGSSLVYMCDRLIRRSGHVWSGFFLDDVDTLAGRLRELSGTAQKVLLIGVSYALMDLCELDLRLGENITVMETGGMKGRRKEMLKPELHAYLKRGLGVSAIHSEYGMTELLSQAYSTGDGLFKAPPWLRFLTREVDDPLKIRTDHRTGGINVVDLANLHSCCFIATKDLGRVHADGRLELMGRYDHSDVRGCNLMMGEF